MSPVTAHSSPLIGLNLRAHAQCALPSHNQCAMDRVVLRNIAKFSDHVAIIAINNLQDISSTMSATWEGFNNTSKGEIEAKRLNLE